MTGGGTFSGKIFSVPEQMHLYAEREAEDVFHAGVRLVALLTRYSSQVLTS